MMARERGPEALRIVCVVFADHDHDRQHIEAVGIGWIPDVLTYRLTAEEVREQMSAQPFCTKDAEGNEWQVRRVDCNVIGCPVKTIRSVPDTPEGIRLIDLGECPKVDGEPDAKPPPFRPEQDWWYQGA